LCNETKLLSFLSLNIIFDLSGNFIQCDCTDSYNLLNFIQSLSLYSSDSYKNSSFYSIKCDNFNEYYGKSILNFENSSYCSNFSNKFSSKNCPIVKNYPLSSTSISKLTIAKKVISISEKLIFKVNIIFNTKAQYLILIGNRTSFFYTAKSIMIFSI
jgi:hypothetical protein